MIFNMRFKVERYGDCSYAIFYRSDSFFSFWKRINHSYYQWPDEKPDQNFPVLFDNYADAMKEAKKIKKNPGLIQAHLKTERRRHKQHMEEWREYIDNKPPSITYL